MKPNKKAVKFAIECLDRNIEEFDKLIREYPNDPDSKEDGGWWICRKELKDVVTWMEEEID